MKVLLVNKFHYRKGGSETYYLTLAEALRARGHEVIFFAMKDEEKNLPCDQERYFVSNASVHGGIKSKLNMVLHMNYSKEAYRNMTQLLKAEKPDLVILNLVLIGQFGSGSYLCFVAIIQSFIALSHTKKGESVGIVEGIIFTLLYVGFGIFGIVTAPDFIPAINYKNMLEILPILGALAQMVSVFVRDEQATRKWLLWNTVFWMIYAAAVGSSVFINDFLAFVSISSALYKYRKKNNDKTPA